MPQTNHSLSNTEMLEQALIQLDLSLREGCPRACAASAFMFGCLAHDRGYGTTFCGTCAAISGTLSHWRRDLIAARHQTGQGHLCLQGTGE